MGPFFTYAPAGGISQIMLDSFSTRQSSIVKYWVVSATVMVLTGCLEASDKLKIEAVTTTPETPVSSPESVSIGPTTPLRYGFPNQSTYVARSTEWLFRRVPVIFVADQGHNQFGSILVKERTETWHGPLLRLPPLQHSQGYRVSAWIKPLHTDQSTHVTLVLTKVVDGITRQTKLGHTIADPHRWHKVEGEFVVPSTSGDQIRTLHFDVEHVSTTYLIDDVMVSFSEYSEDLTEIEHVVNTDEQVILNGGAEEDLAYWSHQGGAITRTSVQAHTGNHSIFISARSREWHAPTMDVPGLKNSQRYKFSVFTKLEEGHPPTTMKLTLKRVTNGQVTFTVLAEGIANDTDWTELIGLFSASNITESQLVTVYVESNSPTVSYYVDTLTAYPIP